MSKFQIAFLSLLGVITCLIFSIVGVLSVTLLSPTQKSAVISQPVAANVKPVPVYEPTVTSQPTSTSIPTLPLILPTASQPTATSTRVVPPTTTPTPRILVAPLPEKKTLQPTSVPQPVQQNQPAEVMSATIPDNEADFKEFLRGKYSTIAGTPLEIESISILNEGGEYPLRAVDIELTNNSALYKFGEQTEANAVAYGTNLLKDTIAYFKGQECSAYVSYNFDTDNLLDIYFDDEWYYIGSYDLDDGWYVSRDYVITHFINGRESVKVWNYK